MMKWFRMKRLRGYDYYHITNEGHLISTAQSKAGKQINGVSHIGYLRASLWRNKILSERVLIHKLVALYFVPNPENKPEVNHIDGNRQNNAAYNLEWVTSSENSIDIVKRGNHHYTKLTCGQVLEIRRIYQLFNNPNWQTIKTIAIQFDVSANTINNVVKRITWKFL